jgi:hypothetical protein
MKHLPNYRENEMDQPKPPDADALADAGLDSPRLTNDDVPGAPLSLAERNAARQQALESIGVGVRGIQLAFAMRCIEHLLSRADYDRLSAEHEEWLAAQLDMAEEMVAKMQQDAESERRKGILTRKGKG